MDVGAHKNRLVILKHGFIICLVSIKFLLLCTDICVTPTFSPCMIHTYFLNGYNDIFHQENKAAANV